MGSWPNPAQGVGAVCQGWAGERIRGASRSQASASNPAGSSFIVEDRAGRGVDNLQRETERADRQAQSPAASDQRLDRVRSNTPELFLDIDRRKVASLGVSFDDLNKTLGIYLGSLYVTNFNEFGRYWQVNLQSEGQFRSRIEDINLLYVRKQPGPHGPPGHAGHPARDRRSDLRPALQPLHGRADHRQPGAGHQLGRRHCRDRRRGQRHAAALDGQRVDRADLLAIIEGNTHRPRLRSRGVGCLSGAVGAV